MVFSICWATATRTRGCSTSGVGTRVVSVDRSPPPKNYCTRHFFSKAILSALREVKVHVGGRLFNIVALNILHTLLPEGRDN